MSTATQRTHHCSELTRDHNGQEVCLVGWIDSIRDHGGVLFIDLRDRNGLTQVLMHPSKQYSVELSALKPESVIGIRGIVEPRSAETVNPNMVTGEVEVLCETLHVFNISQTPPFPLDDEKAKKVGEDLRLRYRYLDLRRPSMQHALKVRHRASKIVHNYLDRQGYLEVETPYLFKSSPEGAREFLVPSRLNVGEFYALSQSPQQMKQMLMVAGLEKYYQIARCFRDEDLRADRQPEFTQIDIEASFVQREDIYTLIEGMLKELWKEILGIEIQTPFLRLTYQEAMNRFGSDKPDLRYPFELEDFSEAFRNSAFKVFQSVIASGGVVKAINIKGLADITQGELKALEDTAKSLGAKGLAFIKVENGEWKSPILKFFSDAEKQQLQETLHMEDGDIVFFAASDWQTACTILGRIRLDSVALLKKRSILTVSPDDYQFLWVVDFPLMLRDEETGKYAAAHHPFTAPLDEDIPLLDSDPKSARSKAYDCVLNGNEIGGGSIRIHEMSTQKKIFENVLAIPEDIVESRFGYMLEAFKYGAPPHGGIALGFDRLITILTGKDVIRDVIAFPKTQKGQDLMAKCPGPVEPKQLRDLRIQTSK
ncbi:MAG: aspartate--tRNA ligase [Puniceicoccaceae bacterium]